MIIDTTQLLIYIPAALVLNLTPGSDMLFCLGQGIKSGPKAGIAAGLGIGTGALIHSLVAAFGLAALLATNPLAFEFVRWAGVSYLLYLAVQTFRHPPAKLSDVNREEGCAMRAWREAILVNLLNPKVAIFILALVPQFVDPTRGSTILQFLIFCAILTIGGTIINALVGACSGGVGKVLATNHRASRIFQWTSSAVFLGLAAKLAFERR